MIRHKYCEEELEFIRQNVKGITLKELTSRFNKKFDLNVTEDAIAGRKTKLGISSGIVGGQFVKGQTPPNKGKTWNEYMPKDAQERCRKTTFKKGNIPKQWRPVGSERIDTKDGYLYVKVADPNKWELKHRLVWEKENGKIPEGHKLIFKDGNRKNVDINNLILVSAAEELIMNRQGLFSKNSEVTETGALIAKVISKASKRRRDVKK